MKANSLTVEQRHPRILNFKVGTCQGVGMEGVWRRYGVGRVLVRTHHKLTTNSLRTHFYILSGKGGQLNRQPDSIPEGYLDCFAAKTNIQKLSELLYLCRTYFILKNNSKDVIVMIELILIS